MLSSYFNYLKQSSGITLDLNALFWCGLTILLVVLAKGIHWIFKKGYMPNCKNLVPKMTFCSNPTPITADAGGSEVEPPFVHSTPGPSNVSARFPGEGISRLTAG